MNPTTLNLLAVSVFAFMLLSLVGPLLNISPNAVALLATILAGGFALDRFVANGIGGNLLIDLLSRQSSEYRQRIIHHEAGHFLVAHLLGIPVQSYTLSAWEATRAGFPGLGGVIVDTTAIESKIADSEIVDSEDTRSQTADAKTNVEAADSNSADSKQPQISDQELNQYCIVWMAGIAAETQTYGNAQGGADDKFRLKQLWQQISPDARAMANPDSQTRWALLQAQTLIETQQAAYQALVTAMTNRDSVDLCVQQINSNRVATDSIAA